MARTPISPVLLLALTAGCSSLGGSKDGDAPSTADGAGDDGGSGSGDDGGSGSGGSGSGGSGSGAGDGGSGSGGPVDEDGDGYTTADDCDDGAADVHPGADETPYNGTDDDCDPATPDDDLDGDGFGIADDCDDDDPAVHPDATELRGDGVDNDCDPNTCHGGGFAAAESVFTLPTGLSTWDQPFYATAGTDYCYSDGSGRPAYLVMDLDGDGQLDFVATTDCDDDTVGADSWSLYSGAPTGFSSTASAWSLPTGLSTWEQPFYATAGTDYCYSDGSGRPAFLVLDLDGDGQLDFVSTTDCADADVGASEWTLFPGGSPGFATSASAWSLPTGLSTWEQPFYATAGTDYCYSDGSGRPAYLVMDLTGDGQLDFVATTSCADPSVGDTHWVVYAGSSSGFAATGTDWALPTGLSTWEQPFYATAGTDYCYSDGSGRPAYLVMDLTGDGQLDFVATTSCTDDTVGDTHWTVFEGTGSGFASSGTAWSLPTGLSTWTQPFYATAGTDYCYSDGTGRPAYLVMDLTGDGQLDFVATTSCTDDTVGDRSWDVYEGGPTGFSTTALSWALPAGLSTWTQPFYATAGTDYCYSDGTGRPAYLVMDLTGDGQLDFVATTSCADDAVGASRWHVYAGECDL